MRRREFVAGLGGAAAWPLAARAQQPGRMRRIGHLENGAENDPEQQARVAALREGLAKLDWVEGRNFHIDVRFAAGDGDRARTYAAELVRLAPDVILANGNAALQPLQQATRTIPIVFTNVSEPVVFGFVQSLAHPGGNITGFTNLEPTVGAKWLQLLKEIAPRVTRVAVMFNPGLNPLAATQRFRSTEAAATNFAVDVVMAAVHARAEIEAVMTTLGREPGGALILPGDAFTSLHRKLIVELAARYRLPAISSARFFTAEGGLVSYGVDGVDQYRKAAGYVDRILRGEKPADLPVQQPTKFELLINLKTARTLGLTVPDRLLALADKVIE
jgi:ABC-type uncharacterized transport system substrate-binding protein